ncbi:hypothetical protein [Cupriavidus metallidurans]|uniref:hypothetical protein n=1 Tax=Cupriavidus metallidurans TaxID=119219 RepID=UPI001CC9FDFC|nr:hypothetical protein [Cupriavidus metallidurans]UBM12747.1 hypothetical protein LAI70_28450 [Cupriavidus metallidurans]
MKITHTPDYAPLRADDYPAIEEQLDALWHAMDRGELPKIVGFYDRIKAVKDRFPKAPSTP